MNRQPAWHVPESGRSGQPQKFQNVTHQLVINLGMAGDRLLSSIGRVLEHVMIASVPNQSAARLFEMTDQLAALHKAMVFS
jgi:hypothetical protein